MNDWNWIMKHLSPIDAWTTKNPFFGREIHCVCCLVLGNSNWNEMELIETIKNSSEMVRLRFGRMVWAAVFNSLFVVHFNCFHLIFLMASPVNTHECTESVQQRLVDVCLCTRPSEYTTEIHWGAGILHTLPFKIFSVFLLIQTHFCSIPSDYCYEYRSFANDQIQWHNYSFIQCSNVHRRVSRRPKKSCFFCRLKTAFSLFRQSEKINL